MEHAEQIVFIQRDEKAQGIFSWMDELIRRFLGIFIYKKFGKSDVVYVFEGLRNKYYGEPFSWGMIDPFGVGRLHEDGK